MERSAESSFSRVLRDAVRPVDVVVLCAVPVVLLAVFALPVEVRRALAFSYGDPTLVTAYTANFVHIDAGHLTANLLAYAIVVPTVYLLSVVGGTRRWFYVFFATFLLVLPFALMLLNLAVPRPGFAVGFSGVVMAFVGVLPLALASYLASQFGIDAEREVAGALFFGGLALIALIAVSSDLTLAVAVLSLAAAALHLLPVVESSMDARARDDLRATIHTPGYVELAGAGLFIFAWLTVVSFPVTSIEAGLVNLYAHLLGFSLGFIPAYVTVLTTRRLPALQLRRRVRVVRHQI